MLLQDRSRDTQGGQRGSQGASLPPRRLGSHWVCPRPAPRPGLSPRCPAVLGRASGAKAEDARAGAALALQPAAPREVGAALGSPDLPLLPSPSSKWGAEWRGKGFAPQQGTAFGSSTRGGLFYSHKKLSIPFLRHLVPKLFGDITCPGHIPWVASFSQWC